MKKALVHDWFITSAGAEKCIKSFTNIWNDFDTFTLFDFFEEKDRKEVLKEKHTMTSFLQNFPFAKKLYKNFLPFYPYAIEQFDLSKYDLILSSSHAVAKGVLTNHNQLHICYMHTPMRYAWDLYHQYLKDNNLRKGIKANLAQYFLHKIRIWDVATVNRVDYFIANSNYVKKRIKKIYNRDSKVIYPPVDIEKFQLCEKKENFYLVVSRLISYKKVDLIVKAFKNSNKKLVVIGDGPELNKIKKLASNNIKVLGFQKYETVINYMRKAKAFVFAAIEDFGISVVEAQACGTPVICLSKGGTKETVIDGITGVHFKNQEIEDIKQAIEIFEGNQKKFIAKNIRDHSLQFSKERFEKDIKKFVNEKYEFFRKENEI